MLFLLNPANPFHRIIRRGLVMGVFAFVGVVLSSMMELMPAYAGIFTALLAFIDKASREFSEK